MLQVRWPRTNGTAVTFSKIQRERKKGRARISEEKEKERANSKEKIISKVQKAKEKERESLGFRTRMGILRRSRMGFVRLDDSGVVTASAGNATSCFSRFIDQRRASTCSPQKLCQFKAFNPEHMHVTLIQFH